MHICMNMYIYNDSYTVKRDIVKQQIQHMRAPAAWIKDPRIQEAALDDAGCLKIFEENCKSCWNASEKATP